MALTNVLFPEPDSPAISTRSPGKMVMSVSSTTAVPSFNLTDVLEVGVESDPIAGTDISFQQTDFARDRIENARILLSSCQALFLARSISEHSFKSHPRVDFSWERLGRRRP